MGDDRFARMLREIVSRYRFKNLTTEQFHAIAQEFMPPKTPDSKLDVFFEQWVYGTGIPKLKLSYAVHGKAPAVKVKGSLAQTEVDEDFSSAIPIDVQLAGKRSLTEWVMTSGEPAPFSFDLKQAPVRIAVDVGNTLSVH
jgi:aminopeptidase N